MLRPHLPPRAAAAQEGHERPWGATAKGARGKKLGLWGPGPVYVLAQFRLPQRRALPAESPTTSPLAVKAASQKSINLGKRLCPSSFSRAVAELRRLLPGESSVEDRQAVLFLAKSGKQETVWEPRLSQPRFVHLQRARPWPPHSSQWLAPHFLHSG